MRTLRNLVTLGLATLSLGVLAQAPPPPPGGPAPMPPLPMDPKVQRELHLSKAQIAKIRALLPPPPRPGAKPPLPPKPGVEPPVPPRPGAIEAKIDAILTPAQRAQLRKIRARHTPPTPVPPVGGPPVGGPRPTKP